MTISMDHTLRITDYPHKYDADRAVAQQMISLQQEAEITAAWEKRVATLEPRSVGS